MFPAEFANQQIDTDAGNGAVAKKSGTLARVRAQVAADS